MDAYKRIELIGGTEAMPHLVKKNQMVVRTVDKHSTGRGEVDWVGRIVSAKGGRRTN